MEYFTFTGFDAGDQLRFQEFMDSQDSAFAKQVDFNFEGQSFGFHIKQPAAGAFKTLPDGTIKLTRQSGQPNLRVRISPMWKGDSQRWRYLHLDKPYRFELDFYLPYREDDYRGVNWANLFEIWGPYDGNDTGRNPAFELMLRGAKGEFEVRQRGDSRKNHDRDYEYQKVTARPFRHGNHTLVVDTVLSHEGKGSTKVWLDGVVVFDESNITNTYNSDPFGDGKPTGGVINFPEIYAPDSSVEDGPIEMFVSRMRVSDEVGTSVLPLPVTPPEPSQPPTPTPEPKEEETMQGDFNVQLNFSQKEDGTYDVTGTAIPASDKMWDPPTTPPPATSSPPKYSSEIIDTEPLVHYDFAPKFDAISNSLEYPRYLAEAHELRGWENPSAIYAKSTLRVYGTVKHSDGQRSLYEKASVSSSKRLLKSDVIFQSVCKSGTGLAMFAIQKTGGSLSLISGTSLDHTNWSWRTEAYRDYLPKYGLGDLLHAYDGKLWIKGDEFVKNSAGKYVDYRRYWFCDGEELKINLPQPKTGRRYDIYSMAVFKPSTRGWACKTTYVALLGLFHIANDDDSWNHKGTIDLVWATSNDGVEWSLPFGVEPAYDRGDKVKMVQPGAFLPYGNDLKVYCGAARFGHNEYDTAVDKTVGAGVITMPKAKFERAFG